MGESGSHDGKGSQGPARTDVGEHAAKALYSVCPGQSKIGHEASRGGLGRSGSGSGRGGGRGDRLLDERGRHVEQLRWRSVRRHS